MVRAQQIRCLGYAALVSLLAGASGSAFGHHSFAMYDQTQEITMTGRLTRFIPGANHAQLIFERLDESGETVLNEDGKPAIWGIETPPAAQIARAGITVDSFPIGTILTVTLNPLRDGRPFGAGARGAPIISCGLKVPPGGCNAETGQSFRAR
jgi:hypothetical protein